MANTNPARGMRDFLPVEVRKREYVIGIIKEVYQKYGFEPLETPSVENLETLMGKYGEEGNQLIFKILERGEKIQKKLAEGTIKSENELSDLALRYDLTVPLARVVANYKDKLPKFFKRYQIQPVWRADRPARGRFREFYQCDVDAIGSSSMIVEAELISAVCEILERLGFEDFLVRLNHRDMLSGLLEITGFDKESYKDIFTILDKTDKIGIENVNNELASLGYSGPKIGLFLSFLQDAQEFVKSDFGTSLSLPNYVSNYFDGTNPHILNWQKQFTAINQYALSSGANRRIRYDPGLVRGLSYYTGAIFEIVLTNGDFAGSIGGGGRYDGLIGMFGKEQIPACGFSLGLERILVVMEERGMFPPELQTNSADVMVTIWNEESIGESLKLANELRSQGLRVLVYPEADKLGKQFKYAGQINIPFVCILGENELAENKVAVKNMVTGEQEVVAREEVAAKIK